MVYLGIVIVEEIPDKPVRWDIESMMKEVDEDHDLASIGSRDILA